MTSTCGPFQATPGGCQPKTEVFWAQKPADASPVLLYLQTTCLGGLASRALTQDKDGLVPAVGYTEADKLANAIKRERGASCQDPVHVAVCEPGAVSVEALDAEACDGTTLSVQAKAIAEQVVNAPGTALLVKMCGPSASLKIEFSETLMYSASTEQSVMRVREYNEELGTWSLRYENLDGTPFVGTLPTDLTAVETQVQVVRTTELGCSAGQAFVQRTTARFDSETGALESESTDWIDNTGAVLVVAPAGWSFGPCAQPLVTKRPICVNMQGGEVWNVVEVVSALDGVETVSYVDPDTSPMADVTSQVLGIRHGGPCDCCNDGVDGPDVSITKTLAGGTNVGDPATYTITVTNHGPGHANNTVVQETFPDGFEVTDQGATISEGAVLSGVSPQWVLPLFPEDAVIVITLVGTFTTPGSKVNTVTATLDPSQVDPVPDNNMSTVPNETALLPADLGIVKTGPATRIVGEPVSYVITASNAGPGAADGATITDTPPAGFVVTDVQASYSGGASGLAGTFPDFAVGIMPGASSVSITVTGTYTEAGNVVNSASITPPTGVIDPDLTNNISEVGTCLADFEIYHEIITPLSTLMGTYGDASTPGLRPFLGFVNPTTGVLTPVGTVPNGRLNSLGLDKSTNNAVMIDRVTGVIYTANSPGYVVTPVSTLGAGPVAAENAIMGALDSTQTYWVGNIVAALPDATITVSTVDPLTGVQTPVPSLTATLASGGNGYDFDFAPNNDLYALLGLNIYVATFASGYAGWTSVGVLSGVPDTGGSIAYDQGVLRGTTSTGQMFAFDITTGATTITGAMPAGTAMADWSGAVDPVCKRIYRNTCDGQFYELNKVTSYVSAGVQTAGDCV